MHSSRSLAFVSGLCTLLFSSTQAVAVPFNTSSTVSSLAPSNSTTATTLASSTSSTAVPTSVLANSTSSLPLNTTTLIPPTATQSGWYTFKNTTSKAAGSTPAPVNLAPAAPPGLDPHDPVILKPNNTVNLFYQGSAPPGNASNIPVASVAIPKMAYPAVVLDHSALVTHVECDPNNLRIKFLHKNALNTAKSAWTMPKFVMTSFYEGCGQASSTGERDYLLVHALDFKPDTLQVDAKIKHIGVKEAVGDENPITLDMGTYTPTSADGNVGFDSSNAPPIPNNSTAQNTTGSAADFDVALDNSIGYTSLNATSHVKRFLGLEPHARLQGRGFFSKIWKAVKKVVQKFIPSWTLTPLNKNININLGGGNVMTPWNKKGYQLYSTGSGTNYVRLYCVDCGVNGVINVKATVTFNLIGIVSAGSFSANGNMAAGLGLGVDANYATSIPGFSKTLVAIPLSPFAIPGLITIGPHLDLGVGANAHFSASGKLYAGVSLKWPAIHAQLNLLSAPSASGFTPTLTHTFEAEGKISLGADAYVLVTIGFGISILNGLKSFGVSLVEKPDLYITGATGQTGCSGLQFKVGFKNEVYADIFGSHKALSTWNGPSATKCVSIKKRDVLELPGISEEEMRKRAESTTSGSTVHIQTPEHDIGIHYADNGNMYALPAVGENGTVIDMSTVLFAAKDGIITGDASSRVFHGYMDTLSSIGISRFRLSKSSHIPSTAVPVTLQGVAFENQNVLVAVDAARNQFYPMLCVFGDTDFPKLFLAKDPHAGIDTLKSDANVAAVTGVKPEDCDFIPLITV